MGCSHQDSRPNVLLIVLDTVRADAVSIEWNEQPVTPNLDRIAAEGARFENAYATAPWTLPSHATLFTGLAPSQHRAVHENFALASEYATLAERLADRQYATYGITSNPWVTAGRGLAQGFDEFKVAYSNAEQAPDKGAARATEYATDFVARAAETGKPFFLFVNYLEAHLPYAPPNSGFEALGIAVESLSRREFSVEQAEEIIAGKREASASESALARTLYLCEIAYQDQLLGKLSDALRDNAVLDDTLIVITSDHGELLGKHGLMGHEFSLSDDVLHVPLILRFPNRIEAGQRVALPVSHLDVVPTVLDILGGHDVSEAAFEGRSLLALQKISGNRPLIAEYSKPVTLLSKYWASRHPDFDTEAYAVSLQSLRKGKTKLVENTRGEFTLTDRGHDTPDYDDPARQELAREMREELALWIARLGKTDPR